MLSQNTLVTMHINIIFTETHHDDLQKKKFMTGAKGNNSA